MNTNIKFNAEYFPDAEFREYLMIEFDWEEGQELTVDERNKVTIIRAINEPIESFKGIEYFPKLWGLNISNTNITSLDVRKNKKLELLSADNTNLTSLDVRKNKKLWSLDIAGTNIQNINIKKNRKLEYRYLECYEHVKVKNTFLNELRMSFQALMETDANKISNRKLKKRLKRGKRNIIIIDVILFFISFFIPFSSNDLCTQMLKIWLPCSFGILIFVFITAYIGTSYYD